MLQLLIDVQDGVLRYLAGVAVQADVLGGEADLLDSFPHNLLIVDLGSGCNFTEDHDHAGLGSGFASNLQRNGADKFESSRPV